MIALDKVLEEHADAIAYDLIAMGLRLRDLGSDEFTWGDLRVIVTQAPRSSCLYRALYPDEYQWGLQEQLMALVADMLSVANWQRGSGASKDYPKPIPRPGIEDDTASFGEDAMSIEDMDDWLNWK
jgi:hypothetical protein